MFGLPFDPVIVAIPFFALFILAELWIGIKHHRQQYQHFQSIQNCIARVHGNMERCETRQEFLTS